MGHPEEGKGDYCYTGHKNSLSNLVGDNNASQSFLRSSTGTKNLQELSLCPPGGTLTMSETQSYILPTMSRHGATGNSEVWSLLSLCKNLPLNHNTISIELQSSLATWQTDHSDTRAAHDRSSCGQFPPQPQLSTLQSANCW
ncbi:hypothetical protein RRG08_064852 [Elysia crispata]|uniref:Uncharacterized protein n=1 Tax=Elysia crispata TaxID=231223 RepID=A0AAE1DSI1_9GAST|nr:hypothetical protein RRG08_064852 [Elysia crispata]